MKVNITALKRILKVYDRYKNNGRSDIYKRPIFYKSDLWIINGVSVVKMSSDYVPMDNEFEWIDAETEIPTFMQNTIKNMIESALEFFRITEDDYRAECIDKNQLKAAIKCAKNENRYKTIALDLGGVYVNAQYLLDHISLIKRKEVVVFVGEPLKPIIIGQGKDNILSLLLPLRIHDDIEIIPLKYVTARYRI